MKVLDLGCGEYERRISGAIGIDINYDDVDLLHNIREGLPFDDDSVDMIVSTYTFAYLWDNYDEFKNLVAEVNRVLKSRGMVIIQDYLHQWNEVQKEMIPIKHETIESWWIIATKEIGKLEVQSFTVDLRNLEGEYTVILRK